MFSLVLVFHQPCIVSANIVHKIRKWDVEKITAFIPSGTFPFQKAFVISHFVELNHRSEKNTTICKAIAWRQKKSKLTPSPLWSNYGYFIMAGCNCSSHDYAPLSSLLYKENFVAINVCLWLFIEAPVKLFYGKHPGASHEIRIKELYCLYWNFSLY